MALADWDDFVDRHLSMDTDTARYLYEHGHGIESPEDITGIDFGYNHETGLWETTIETDYRTVVVEDESPAWYNEHIRSELGDALYEDYDIDYGPTIDEGYKKSKGAK